MCDVYNTYIRTVRHVQREKCRLTRKVIRVDGEASWSVASLEKRKSLPIPILSFRVECLVRLLKSKNGRTTLTADTASSRLKLILPNKKII